MSDMQEMLNLTTIRLKDQDAPRDVYFATIGDHLLHMSKDEVCRKAHALGHEFYFYHGTVYPVKEILY